MTYRVPSSRTYLRSCGWLGKLKLCGMPDGATCVVTSTATMNARGRGSREEESVSDFVEPCVGMKVKHRSFGTVGHIEKIDGPWVLIAFCPRTEGKSPAAQRVKFNKYILWEKYEAVQESEEREL